MDVDLSEVGDIVDQPGEISLSELDGLLKTSRNASLIFDIETGPADEGTLLTLFGNEEVELPKHPGEFNARKVKYGNIKDPAKKSEKLAMEISKHRLALENWEQDCEQTREAAWEKFVEGAALRPDTGRVLAIGYGLKLTGWKTQAILDVSPEDEQGMLLRLWQFVAHVRMRGGKLVAYNGHNFDIPFTIRRSWAYPNVRPPKLRTIYNKFEDFILDPLTEYKMGGYGSNHLIKLDNLAQLMGVRRKVQGVKGALWHKTLIENRDLALEYLIGDVLTTSEISERMRII